MELIVLYTLTGVSLCLNIILGVKVIKLQKELKEVKNATRLTKEEVEKLNERLRKLKMGG